MARSSGSLPRYLATRLLLVIPMLWILLTIVFILMRVAPGDPVQAAQGGRLSGPALEKLRHENGFDKSILAQYGDYISGVVHGDFGKSTATSRTVTDVVLHEGMATLELTVAAMMFALVVGLSIGVLIGRYRDTPLDVGGRLFGVLTYAAPVFWVGILFQILFVAKLQWLPGSGQADTLVNIRLQQESVTNIYVVDAIIARDWEGLRNVLVHLILPSVTLGLLITGVFIRLVRVNIIQTLKHDYIESARARGISEHRVVLRHAFRNALVPVVTVIGLQMALLLSGAVLTEQTFNWPGIGQALIQFLNNRDYVMVQGIVTVFALIVVGVSLVIDIVTALIDPRVRYS